MNTWHIHIEGQVQGVGFRPFVFVLAREHGLNGWVNNTTDGVHIVFNAEETQANAFKNKILTDAPALSKITALHLNLWPATAFTKFEIVHSDSEAAPKLLLTPDFALCTACREELRQMENRRFSYPFITCTHCGPRFSIVQGLPYDRTNTAMDAFQMCSSCRDEYDNPLNRRYYSQTNSCPDCGIALSLYDADQNEVSQQAEEILERISQFWEVGKIVAIKGIGGFLLTCDASNETAVAELRKRKHRPSKPFAVMYPREQLSKDFNLDKAARELLEGPIAPIVLLEKGVQTSMAEGVAPGLEKVGLILPYAPLFECLLHSFGRAIVATSGNVSHSPIIYQDQKALQELVEIADFVLLHNRDIALPQDDSVITHTLFQQHKIILRRSRGLAPTYINPDLDLPTERILAMGAMLKSTFTLLNQGHVYVSQYLGDLAHFDAQLNYQYTIRHFLNLFRTRPAVVLIDQHPSYPSFQVGKELAAEYGASVYAIQHHQAHFGAVLGECNQIHTDEPILGVIWDGTGLGDDQQIWGGEFFVYEDYQFRRSHHFEYFDFILGDKMPREPRISALSACWDIDGATALLREKFNEQEWKLYSKLLSKENPLQTSSLGRIFDAVAAMLGILDRQTYEGEAAMRLEAAATRYFKQSGLNFSSSYFEAKKLSSPIPTRSLMGGIIKDLQADKNKEYIAAKFHYSLVHLIQSVATELKIKKLAFSGGVFQNSLLVDLLHHHLSGEFELFFHRELSPNDENISFGQVVCYQIRKHRQVITNNKSNDHVLSDSW
ncbi:MAG: carbamoyltransferase HypF [Saprospiraceae bacterium]|nr:carbamoyltransferase HypF [Saprospiraceae bacterium]